MNRGFVGALFTGTLRLALGLSFGLASAGCGGSQPPIGAPGVKPQSRAIAPPAMHGKSSILASAHYPAESNGDLLYIGNWEGDSVEVVTYPEGQPVGTISGLGQPSGMCSDRSGNVWLVTTASGKPYIYEFAHGGLNPIAQLPPQGHFETSCTVDPKSGNLAVLQPGPNGNVAIWPQAEGTPTVYSTGQSLSSWALAYDGSGNLFVTGNIAESSVLHYVLYELPYGTNEFKSITLNARAEWAGAIGWDGNALVIVTGGRTVTQRAYRLRISGSKAHVIAKLRFEHMGKSEYGLTIQGNTIMSGMTEQKFGAEAFWRYPDAGKPYHRFAISSFGIQAVSVAPPH